MRIKSQIYIKLVTPHCLFLLFLLKFSLCFVSFVVTTVTHNHCLVCFGGISGAHKCVTCRRPVHIKIGHPVGKEGYGQKVKCHKCCDRGYYMSLIFLFLLDMQISSTLSKSISFYYFHFQKC